MVEPGVLIVGAGAAGRQLARALTDHGRRDVVVVDEGDIVSCVFDDRIDRWEVRIEGGEVQLPRVVVAGSTVHDIRFEGMQSYQCVAVAGFPNCFLLESNSLDRVGYIAECLALMDRVEATRMEVRAGSQREFDRVHRGRRVAPRRVKALDYNLSNVEEREPDTEYSGNAELSLGARRETVQVALSGHFEPLDGMYHWYGRVGGAVAPFKKPNGSPLFLTIEAGPETPAALAEQDPWGNYRITGVGTPPWAAEVTGLPTP
ncbi:DUF4873 domain-containing protein [Antrihabitans cavernicola]|uniref:DUF4873 domain-containing protein n=1 Tax=Antrihabitans cavernicola TaxID=2495913 RepID=A0A5A7SHN6_9NOCA|nr:DUF4873 domain-containing protein [Spelaeibacter cavernicola]KAA0024123.1 DUF4873 domain-containing protein [Spelaeibacter cavernicola]